MQFVASAVDGTVLKLPQFANQDDWMVIFNQAIYIIHIDDFIPNGHALMFTFVTSWENAKRQ